jgi:hypothetical protein
MGTEEKAGERHVKVLNPYGGSQSVPLSTFRRLFFDIRSVAVNGG